MTTYIALLFVAMAVLHCSSAPTSDVNNEDGTPKSLPPTTEAAVLPTASAGQEKVTQKEKIVCEPKAVFKVFCNTCRCSNDGTEMACTRRLCPEDVSDDESFKVPLPTSEAPVVENEPDKDNSSADKKIVCEPGTGFKQECNDCFCTKDGSGYACTRMACPPGVYNEDGSLKVPESTSSIATITEGATSETTQEATSEATSTHDLESISKIPWGPLYVQGTPCPEQIFYSECNQCFCGKNGISAGCTLMLCDGLRKIYEEQNKNTTRVA